MSPPNESVVQANIFAFGSSYTVLVIAIIACANDIITAAVDLVVACVAHAKRLQGAK